MRPVRTIRVGHWALMTMLNRRLFLTLMLASCLVLQERSAFASDDGGSGGGGGGDGGSGGGSGNSGSGSGNSGSGNQNDDDNDDDDGDDGGSGSGSQSRARDAVRAGATNLRRILAQVKRAYPGEVVSVNLRGRGRNLAYAIKIVDQSNRLITVRVNARTGVIIP
jgi:hypothetical protein